MSIHCLLFLQDVDPRGLHSSPTRRSSDLATSAHSVAIGRGDALLVRTGQMAMCRARGGWGDYAGGDAPGLSFWTDRKSTRLNSSHQIISYAVFCLKKKNSSSSIAVMTSSH